MRIAPTVPTRGAFTLLELLVVITLISLAVGLAAFKLDGLTASGRLRSAAGQLHSLIRLAQSEASISGEPRLVTFSMDEGTVRVHRSLRNAERWDWDEGLAYGIGTNMKVERLLTSRYPADSSGKERSVRIAADGRFPATGVVLHDHSLWAVVLLRPFEEESVTILTREPQAVTLDLLILETQRVDHAG